MIKDNHSRISFTKDSRMETKTEAEYHGPSSISKSWKSSVPCLLYNNYKVTKIYYMATFEHRIPKRKHICEHYMG